MLTSEQAISILESAHPTGKLLDFKMLVGAVRYIYNNNEEFLAHYLKIDTDFVFDVKSGLYFVGVPVHVDLNAALFNYFYGKENNKYEASDQYILSGFGIFKSRAGHKILCGPGFVLSSDLNKIKRDLQVI